MSEEYFHEPLFLSSLVFLGSSRAAVLLVDTSFGVSSNTALLVRISLCTSGEAAILPFPFLKVGIHVGQH